VDENGKAESAFERDQEGHVLRVRDVLCSDGQHRIAYLRRKTRGFRETPAHVYAHGVTVSGTLVLLDEGWQFHAHGENANAFNEYRKTPEDRQAMWDRITQAKALRSEGLSIREISKEMGVHYNTAFKYVHIGE
jgi:hypothetical protein